MSLRVGPAPACNAPAQDLLSLRELHAAAVGALPSDFDARVAACLQGRDLAESPQIHYTHPSPFSLTDLLSWQEMAVRLGTGLLPEDFAQRCAGIAAQDICVNCDDRHCMACVTREVHGDCAEHRCPCC